MCVKRCKPFGICVENHIGVHCRKPFAGGFCFGGSDLALGVERLPLQIGQAYHVVVCKADAAHSGADEVGCGRGAQSAQPHYQH